MRIYGEAYLFINFWMDFLSLLIAARLRRARFRSMRAAAGAAVGAVYALAAWAGSGALRGFPALLLTTLAITLIAFGKSGVFLFPWVTASALLLCGLADALLKNGASSAAVLAGCGLAALSMTLMQSRRALAAENTGELILAYRGHTVQLPAMRDSGNLLTDAATGLPVIVAPEQAIVSLLPTGVETANLSTLPSGWRLLPIRTAAGNATLMCFRADKTEIQENGKVRAIDAVIAISGFSEKAALVPGDLFQTERGKSLCRTMK